MGKQIQLFQEFLIKIEIGNFLLKTTLAILKNEKGQMHQIYISYHASLLENI